MMSYRIIKGLRPPKVRELRRRDWAALIELANRMEPYDAAVVNNVEVSTFRVILAAQGFLCVTDGWSSHGLREDNPRLLLAFKLPNKPPELDFQI